MRRYLLVFALFLFGCNSAHNPLGPSVGSPAPNPTPTVVGSSWTTVYTNSMNVTADVNDYTATTLNDAGYAPSIFAGTSADYQSAPGEGVFPANATSHNSKVFYKALTQNVGNSVEYSFWLYGIYPTSYVGVQVNSISPAAIGVYKMSVDSSTSVASISYCSGLSTWTPVVSASGASINVWRLLKMVVNPATGVVDFYVNNVLVAGGVSSASTQQTLASQFNFPATGDIESFIAWPQNTSGSVQIDDVLVRVQ